MASQGFTDSVAAPGLDRKLDLPRKALFPSRAVDVTLINLNLMLVNQDGRYDQESYLPLGVLYLSSFLGGHGYNVELVDYQLFSHARLFDAEVFAGALGKTAPVVGISVMTNLLPFAVLCAQKIKEANPSSRVVMGGVGPSPVARELTEAFPFVDSVVVGEGELSLLELMEKGFIAVPPRRPVEDLDALPLPSYSLIDFSRYTLAPSIISSRGCPYECTFCTEPHNFGGSARLRSIETIIREMELLHELSGGDLFLFQDDILPLKRSRFQELLEAFEGLSFPVRWKCFSRVDLMDGQLMKSMVEHGCVQIRYGIESGSDKTLARIRKGFTIDRAHQTVEQSIRHFPSVHVSFIWGYPFETLEDMEETLRSVELLRDMGASVLLFEFSPLPGSALYREFQDELRFDPDHYSSFVVMGSETVRADGYQTSENHRVLHRMIQEHPRVFPGFYTYESAAKLRMRRRLVGFNATRRTPARSFYDR
jgi:anaerobic magnesium-protoporphyrin IX monomethyl ester cyclase